jgi:hypothetical protein
MPCRDKIKLFVDWDIKMLAKEYAVPETNKNTLYFSILQEFRIWNTGLAQWQ